MNINNAFWAFNLSLQGNISLHLHLMLLGPTSSRGRRCFTCIKACVTPSLHHSVQKYSNGAFCSTTRSSKIHLHPLISALHSSITVLLPELIQQVSGRGHAVVFTSLSRASVLDRRLFAAPLEDLLHWHHPAAYKPKQPNVASAVNQCLHVFLMKYEIKPLVAQCRLGPNTQHDKFPFSLRGIEMATNRLSFLLFVMRFIHEPCDWGVTPNLRLDISSWHCVQTQVRIFIPFSHGETSTVRQVSSKYT